jgi:hypothetical protein
MTYQNVIKDQSFREHKAVDAVRAKDISVTDALDQYKLLRRTLGDCVSEKELKIKSAKKRRLLNNMKDIMLREFIYH